MATDIFKPMGQAGFAAHVDESRITVLMPRQGANRAAAGAEPAVTRDDGLGAMRGLAAALVIYFVVAVLGLTGFVIWHLVR
jgi:hypothetical protein